MLVKVVARGDDKSGVHFPGGHRHLRGDVALVALAVPAPVAEDQEVQAGGPGIRREQAVWQQRGDHRCLRGNKQRANELAACLFHKFAPKYTRFRPLQNKINVT